MSLVLVDDNNPAFHSANKINKKTKLIIFNKFCLPFNYNQVFL